MGGVQAGVSTALEAVEEHSAGPAPDADTTLKWPQPMVVSPQDEDEEADDGDDDNDDENDGDDKAAAGPSQPKHEPPAPKQRSAASQGQPGPSRPPNIPRYGQCTVRSLPLAVKLILCVLPVDGSA